MPLLTPDSPNAPFKETLVSKSLGFLIRHGSPKSGYWEVTDCIAKNDDRAMSYYMEIVEDKAESGFEVSYLDLHGTTPPKKFYHKI